MNSEHQGMPCPVCRSQLVAMERQGVEIDHCPNCRGVWLDRGELDKIIERGAAQAQSWQPVPAPPAGGSYEERRYEGDYRGHHKPHRRKSFLEELFD